MMRYIILGSNGFIGNGLLNFSKKKINFSNLKKYPNISGFLEIMILLLIAWVNLLIIENNIDLINFLKFFKLNRKKNL